MKYAKIFLLLLISFACNTKSGNTQAAIIGADELELVSKKATDTIPTYRSNISKAEKITIMPDFKKYTDVKEKKKAFFDFLRPMVHDENNRIVEDRAKIKSLYATYDKARSISKTNQFWLIETAKKMRINDFDISLKGERSVLLGKVDIVPASLFLAQAANESAWGTSRFATEANNLFGQWCFKKGCGIVPSQRAANETHEVRKFKTVNAAVNSYVNNINSHNAYKKLRSVREEMRANNEVPTGEALAVGLEKYSARGLEYVKEIQSMIRVNKLEEPKNTIPLQ